MSEKRYFVGIADDDDLGMLFTHNPTEHFHNEEEIELFALDEFNIRKKYDTVLEIMMEEFEGMLNLREIDVPEEVYGQKLLELIRFGQIRAQREAKMKKFGWIMDHVLASDEFHADHHTHGVLESFGHTDLQVTLNIDPNDVEGIIGDMVSDIKKGKKFEDGQKYHEVIKNYPVFIRKFRDQEYDRDLLRVIFPDPAGKFPGDPECELAYASQGDDFVFLGKFEIQAKSKSLRKK